MRKFRLHTSAGLLVIGLAFGVTCAHGQAGSPDTTFGNGGTVTTSLGRAVNPLTAFEQSNGDIAVVTGFNNTAFPNLEVFGLVRYTPTGRLIGTTTASFFANGISSPTTAAMQSNGSIVVAGTASTGIDQPTEFAVARFTPNGQLDTTFGNGGLVGTEISGLFPTVSAVIVQSNGQIVVAGISGSGLRSGSPTTVLARYNLNGSLDTTFGAGGIVQESATFLEPLALAQLANGDYLAVGGSSTAAEFSSTGVLQPSVAPGTLVTTSQASSGCCSPVLFQPNGDYVVAQLGPGLGRHGSDTQVFRFSETGAPDTSFLSTPFTFGENTQNEVQAIALQPNGQIIVGGITNAHTTPVTGGLARIDSNGVLDTSFANGGGLVTPPIIFGLLIQADGKIVVVGSNGNLTVSRFLSS